MKTTNYTSRFISVSRIVVIGLIIVITIGIALYFLANYFGLMTTVSTTTKSKPDELTFEVNAINNILTWGSFIVAVLTIVAAVFGIAGFVQFKNGLEQQLNNYSSIFDDAKKLVESAKEIQQYLKAQQYYIEKSNTSLFNSVYIIANQIANPDIASDLIRQQLHSAQIVNLYRPSMSSEDQAIVRKAKLAALLYFQENGTTDDLNDLEHVAKNDKDPDIRYRAQVVKTKIEYGSNRGIINGICDRIKNWWHNFGFTGKN